MASEQGIVPATVSPGITGSWRRFGGAIALSIACHSLVMIGLTQHAGDTIFGGGAAAETGVLRVFLEKLADPRVDEPSHALSPTAAIPPAASMDPPSTSRLSPESASSSTQGVGSLFGLDPMRYYLASELDRRATLLTPVNLPSLGADPDAEGYLLLRLFINENGAVDKVTVVVNDAADLLEPIAIKVFGDARFAPGRKNSAAVRSQMLIEVKLRPEASGEK